MITCAQIALYRTSSDDYDLTERLKTRLLRLRQERRPFYLASAEFDEILRWKLRGQYGRQRERRKANTEDVIRTVTRAALTIIHPDEEYELELRVGILCALRGVSVPVASAVLALVFPEKYAVIDFRHSSELCAWPIPARAGLSNPARRGWIWQSRPSKSEILASFHAQTHNSRLCRLSGLETGVRHGEDNVFQSRLQEISSRDTAISKRGKMVCAGS